MNGLQLLAPIGIAALIGVPLVILFHMRHSTPNERPVPTLRFWLEAAPTRTDDARLRRPPLSLLLILQLLAAAALGIALARPAVSEALAGLGQRTEPTHLIVLIDGSTSMSATDTESGISRFELARQEALERIGSLRQGDVATVMVLGTQMDTFQATNNAALQSLRERLSTLAAPGGRADFNAALRLTQDLILPGIDDQIVVFSDGAIAADPSLVAEIGAGIEFVPLGGMATPNLAVTNLVARASANNPASHDLYARFANFSDEQVTAPVRVLADGLVVSEEPVTIPAQGAIDYDVAHVPDGTRRVTVTLDAPDQLMADNEASLILAQSPELSQQILLVSDVPGFLQRALTSLPGAKVVTVSTIESLNGEVPPGAYDLVVYDGFSPSDASLAAVPVLFINPPLDGVLPTDGVMTAPAIERIRADDPLLAGVDLAGVTIGETPVHRLDGTQSEIIGADEGPLLYRGQAPDADQPMVVITFDLNRSNLPLRVAFPILIANIVAELAPNPLPASVPLGDPLHYEPAADVRTIEIIPPSGEPVTLDVGVNDAAAGDALDTEAMDGASARPPSLREVVFTGTGQPGDYVISETDLHGRTRDGGVFVVNAGHEQESNLRANDDVSQTLALAQGSDSGQASATLQDLWPVLAAVALALLVVEWLWATVAGRRRPRVARSAAREAR